MAHPFARHLLPLFRLLLIQWVVAGLLGITGYAPLWLFFIWSVLLSIKTGPGDIVILPLVLSTLLVVGWFGSLVLALFIRSLRANWLTFLVCLGAAFLVPYLYLIFLI